MWSKVRKCVILSDMFAPRWNKINVCYNIIFFTSFQMCGRPHVRTHARTHGRTSRKNTSGPICCKKQVFYFSLILLQFRCADSLTVPSPEFEQNNLYTTAWRHEVKYYQSWMWPHEHSLLWLHCFNFLRICCATSCMCAINGSLQQFRKICTCWK